MIFEMATQVLEPSHGSRDMISDLAEDVMNMILVHLPIIEVVRTSILSRKWRYKWVTIPDIVFDTNSRLRGGSSTIKSVHAIDQVLLHHVGPIRKFVCKSFVPSCSHIDRWIVFLSRKEIKKLVLRVDENYYDVPSSIFYCHELSHLELFCCKLKVPPIFKGFCNLKVLKLVDIDILEDEFAHLVSESPLLKRLIFRDFNFGLLKICASSLQYLDIRGICSEILLTDSPHLSIVHVNLAHDYDEEFDFMPFLGSLQEIERLTLRGEFLEKVPARSIPEKLSPMCYQLKYLDVEVDFANTRGALAILCLLRSSPNLEELKICCCLWGEEVVFESAAEFWFVQKQFDCPLNRLCTVRFLTIYGTKLDLEFVKFILGNAPALEAMKISAADDISVEDSLVILKELLRYRRASVQAEILYVDHEPED